MLWYGECLHFPPMYRAAAYSREKCRKLKNFAAHNSYRQPESYFSFLLTTNFVCVARNNSQSSFNFFQSKTCP